MCELLLPEGFGFLASLTELAYPYNRYWFCLSMGLFQTPCQDILGCIHVSVEHQPTVRTNMRSH